MLKDVKNIRKAIPSIRKERQESLEKQNTGEKSMINDETNRKEVEFRTISKITKQKTLDTINNMSFSTEVVKIM